MPAAAILQGHLAIEADQGLLDMEIEHTFRGRAAAPERAQVGEDLRHADGREPQLEPPRRLQREGEDVEIVRDGQGEDTGSGRYGAEGHVRQAVSLLPRFGDSYAVVGSWIAAGRPCGLSVREDASPITKNTSRFLPHAIVA